MAWQVRLSHRATKALERMSAKDRRLIIHSLEQIAENPFQGDVRRLAGRSTHLRRRVGAWRVFLRVDGETMEVDVPTIERRTTTTYKKR